MHVNCVCIYVILNLWLYIHTSLTIPNPNPIHPQDTTHTWEHSIPNGYMCSTQFEYLVLPPLAGTGAGGERDNSDTNNTGTIDSSQQAEMEFLLRSTVNMSGGLGATGLETVTQTNTNTNSGIPITSTNNNSSTATSTAYPTAGTNHFVPSTPPPKSNTRPKARTATGTNITDNPTYPIPGPKTPTAKLVNKRPIVKVQGSVVSRGPAAVIVDRSRR